jgi:hypothetical protein
MSNAGWQRKKRSAGLKGNNFRIKEIAETGKNDFF